MDDTRAWVRGEIDGEWLEARVVSRDADGGATLETLSTKEQSTAKAEELLLANELPEQGVEDMTRLNYLHEPALLNNLKHRFERDKIYTYTGKICIGQPTNWAVSKPLYAESLLVKYRAKEFGQLPPHVYAIAEEGYQRILAASALGKQDNQSILVSGESGAGKTESVKVMMQYLAFVSKSGDTNRVAEQVLASNPLLEAFGNARTLRNNNSSRFGKFIEIQFSARVYKMAGARIHIYLLEKSRVTQQSEGERSYHIFYQLLAGLARGEGLPPPRGARVGVLSDQRLQLHGDRWGGRRAEPDDARRDGGGGDERSRQGRRDALPRRRPPAGAARLRAGRGRRGRRWRRRCPPSDTSPACRRRRWRTTSRARW